MISYVNRKCDSPQHAVMSLRYLEDKKTFLTLDLFKFIHNNSYAFRLNNVIVCEISDTPENLIYIQQTYDMLDSLLRRLPCEEFIFNTSHLPDDDPVRLYVEQKEAEKETRPHSLQMECMFTIRSAMRNKCDESFHSLGLPQRLVHLVTYENIAKEFGFL